MTYVRPTLDDLSISDMSGLFYEKLDVYFSLGTLDTAPASKAALKALYTGTPTFTSIGVITQDSGSITVEPQTFVTSIGPQTIGYDIQVVINSLEARLEVLEYFGDIAKNKQFSLLFIPSAQVKAGDPKTYLIVSGIFLNHKPVFNIKKQAAIIQFTGSKKASKYSDHLFFNEQITA